jgi:hypothetical protein
VAAPSLVPARLRRLPAAGARCSFRAVATARLRMVLAVGAAAAVAAGCGTGSEGVSDAKITAALDMKRVQGHYAIDGNPFCSVSKLLHDSGEVKDESSTHRVIASRDGSVGIEIIRPFAPSCKRRAVHELDRLASGRKHRHGGKGGGGGD